MHKALSLNEIIRLIADSVSYGELKSAIAFARCCKSISGPALDSLWRKQTDLGTLLASTLPPPTWKVVNRDFDFVVEPSEEEWDRFSTYARRMREITEPLAFLPTKDAIRILSRRFSTAPILPLLRSLTWLFVPSERLQSCVPLLVSPRLAHIRLHFGDNSPELCLPIIRTLIKASGSLESVEITPEFDRPEMQEAVSLLLLSCNPNLLHRFCVASPISEAALLHAAQLPGLQEFSFRGGTPGLTEPLPPSVFPFLRTMLISMGGLPTWLEILRYVQSKHLIELSVDFITGGEGTLPALSSHLKHSGIHRTLTELRLCPGEEWVLHGASIAPLLVLGQLTSLVIFADCRGRQCVFSLSDRDIEHLVKAMPKLEVLSLGVPCSRQMGDDLTVKSLLAIATHCKTLITLQTHINCDSIVMSTHECDASGSPRSHARPDYDGCPLRSAIFGSCPVPMAGEGGIIVALTLLRLFPRLYDVQWHPFELMSPWFSVISTIGDHNLVRRKLAEFAY